MTKLKSDPKPRAADGRPAPSAKPEHASKTKKHPPFKPAPGYGPGPAHAPASHAQPVEVPQPEAKKKSRTTAPGSGAQTIQHQKFNNAGDLANQVMSNLGGGVLSTVQLRLIFWGREWATFTAPVSKSQIISDVKSMISGPYFDATKQYGALGAFVDRVIDLSGEDPPNPVTQANVANRVIQLIDDDQVPEPDEDFTTALYIVFLPRTVGGAVLATPPGASGAHSYATYSDFDFPADIDNDSVFFAWISNQTRAGISTTVSHEIVEAMTDPTGNTWQVNPTNPNNWNEIGDVCSSTGVLNGVTVQSYWSRSDNSCVIPFLQPDSFLVQWIFKPSTIGHIEWFGGVSPSGAQWQMSRNEMMARVLAGDVFNVRGASSGQISRVGVFYRDATHPYLGTSADTVHDDNLLSLPNKTPS
jgi:Protein of unknown function (DUF3892)